MGLFDSLTVRENGKRIFASWANDIRTSLIAMWGNGAQGETQFTIADGQSTWADVTGLTFDGVTYGHIEVEYAIYRDDGSSDERKESGLLTFNYKPRAETWTINRRSEDDNALNISEEKGGFRLNQTDEAIQLQYKSDSMGGTYTGIMTFRVLKAFAVEA